LQESLLAVAVSALQSQPKQVQLVPLVVQPQAIKAIERARLGQQLQPPWQQEPDYPLAASITTSFKQSALG